MAAENNNLIASMELKQPYTGIVVNAVGSVSKFESLVKASKNDDLVSKYKKMLELQKEKKKISKEYQLSKSEVIIAKNLLEKEKSNSDSNKQLLDDWQKEGIEMIMKGKSVCIFCPTSGGKTYLVKYAINEMRLNRTEKFLAIFVVPTFHLALQTYADIQVTYSGFPASILTYDLIEYNPNSWIWVGTPEVILNYLISKNMRYDVGIFDEIHSISTNVFNDSDRTSSTHSLLSRCNKQVIALSATIKEDDKDKVINYLEKQTGIKKIEKISHYQRAVPQKIQSIPRMDVSPENILRIILKMREEKMLPSFYFYLGSLKMNCKDVLDRFIDFLEKEEEREYKRMHSLADHFNEYIVTYNTQTSEFLEEMNNILKNNPTLPPAIKAKETHLKELRSTLIKNIILKIEDIFRDAVNEDAKSKYEDYVSDEWHNNIYIKGLDQIEGTPELEDLAKLHRGFNNASWDTDSCTELPLISTFKGSFFRFGTGYSNNFNKDGKEGQKMKNIMIQMAAAEGIKETEMEKYINFVIRSMDFGITALVKEIPFFIQYQIMEMLKNKMLGVVFTNESMSMGINYPLRSVVIFSEEVRDYPVSQLLQMAGRCGRRGYDTESHVIFWNISNSKKVNVDNIEPFIHPVEEYSFVSSDFIHSRNKNKLQILYIREYEKLSTAEKKMVVETYRDLCTDEYRSFYGL